MSDKKSTEPGGISNLPAAVPPAGSRALDRAALDRVLARATEIQLAGYTGGESSEMITEAQILEIGKEVGLAPAVIRQALAEERTRVVVAEEKGLLGSIAGPRVVGASRIVSGKPAEILALIDAWMQKQECCQVQRRFADRIVWEPKRGLWSGVQRTVNISGAKYDLVKASCVSATVADAGGDRVHVRLEADLSKSRSGYVNSSFIVGGIGLAAGGGIGLLATAATVVPLVAAAGALAPVAVFGGLAYIIARGHQSVVERMQLALEQVLDRLEHGEMKKPLGGSLAKALDPLLR